MLILNRMIVKKLLKKIALSVILLSFCTLRTNGAEPGFSIYPNGGQVVKPQEGFIVDIEIDSGGRAIVNAKFTLLFDPAVLQLVKAERNNTLFQAWPEDESTLDNENGVVMLTGVAQSRSVTDADGKEGKEYTPYKSSTPDIIARLHFKVLKEAKTTLDWEFNTNNGVFDTTMTENTSPPTKVNLTRPRSATFVIGQGDGSSLDHSKINTGIPMDKLVIFTGVILLLFGGFMIFTRPERRYRKKKGTIIIYDGK